MMMNTRVIAAAAVIALFLLILGGVPFFNVDERELAVRFRFGEIIASDYEPGLHLKVPFIDDVRKYPRPILTVLNPKEPVLTFEKKNLLVDFFIKWRITDVAQFYRATGGEEAVGSQRLLEIVKDRLRGEFAKRTVPQVVIAERRELMDDMLQRSRSTAQRLGIEIVDVRVKRIEFPEKVSDSVYNRMRQERARTAAELRAEGAEAGEKIRAEADRERTITLAEAYRDAERVRGRGDAEAAQIYATAYKKDPEFFAFYRSIEAYRRSMAKPNDLLVLDAKSQFFRYLERSDSNR